MSKEEILKENLIAVDTSSWKEGHYIVAMSAMQEYADQEIKKALGGFTRTPESK